MGRSTTPSDLLSTPAVAMPRQEDDQKASLPHVNPRQFMNMAKGSRAAAAVGEGVAAAGEGAAAAGGLAGLAELAPLLLL